ncbi:ABC transporter ATP-binding protein [Anaerocolumna xylanovorans]|uniref:ATP-binding cassette, subfamily B n=1 Tax=Anaerocolumna xylanovorans DSM 12503 TaxID=1121345 RepID=A0A1M7Y0T6_9FIRM|nr:ABC transporter ATP-binding protein [Anaerocolumna xylanovorans]SHO45199.1 ATP-binding cassette, subfamily B [Anaerocolumna xylanovorans DSM 12503]
MKHIFTYIKPYGLRMLLGFLIKVMGTFMDLGLPWVLAYIIDEVIPLKEIKYILLWGVLMLFLSIGAREFNITANRMASRVAGDTVKRLRHDLFQKIEQLSGAQVDYFSIPSLISRMTSDTYNIHQMVSMMQRLGVRAPIILVGGTILTFTLEPVLTLVLVGILPLLGITVYIVSKKGIPLYSKSQASADKMIRIVRENVNGIRVIKALSKSEHEKQRFKSSNEEVAGNELKAGATMAAINPVMNLLLNGGLTLVVIIGAYRVNSGASEVGKIVAFLSYFTMILNAMLMITRIFVSISKANASANRIFAVLNMEEDLKVCEELEEEKESDSHISFHDVTFSYPQEQEEKDEKDESTNVESISFQIKKGESLGIIGATGSGKTTLLNLLLRFYDIEKGAIYINGKNVKSFSLKNLRKKFGIVFQNDVIFADTIAGNIDFNRNITRDRIVEAAKDAQAADFIDQLKTKEKDGYEYAVAIKGANLSGGQKQRLLIARALAAKPEILVLDDSSSALDYKTDANLRIALRKHYQNTTTIMIAQRISSIMSMDHILVMEDGKMIGYGKHEELLNGCPVYSEIYQSQMGE